MSHIEEYHAKITSGEIIAGEKVKNVHSHIIKNLHDMGGTYIYDAEEAEKAISFIETFCCIPKFKDGRQPFMLELWQKALLS